ncbi:MAG: acetyl-CoA C-acyltransferase [Planctomycetaceae bacterium]
MPEAVIVGGVRTPFVKAGGPLNSVPTPDLGRMIVRELFERLNVDAQSVDELIAGNVAPPSGAANPARVIAIRAGMAQGSIAHTVSRNCASGMESITEAFDRVQSGKAKSVVALGVDSMSNIPVLWQKTLAEKFWNLSQAKGPFRKLAALARIRPRDLAPEIGIKLGLTDPISGLMMGDTAEKLAREYRISREEQDAFALRSHQRAVAAWKANRLADEVMTLYPEPDSTAISQDIGPRDGQSLEALAKLKPFFDRRWGTVTVGNSCQVTDGAVALLIMEKELARSMSLEPLGTIRSYAYAGCDPARMGLGPVYSSSRALQAAKLRMSDMELVELNEAFAAQVLACQRAFANPPADCAGGSPDHLSEIHDEILNVNGGAIALGHPVGASGARLVLTLLNELGRSGKRLGLATMCVGGGQGGAIIVERLGAAA